MKMIDALVGLDYIVESYEIDFSSVVFELKCGDLDKVKTEISIDQSQVEYQIKGVTFETDDAIVMLSGAQFGNVLDEIRFSFGYVSSLKLFTMDLYELSFFFSNAVHLIV